MSMSRSAAAFLLATLAAFPVTGAEPETSEDILSRYTALTSAEPNCRRGRAADEIIVCGRRDADRYRVPLLVPTPGDPRQEGLYDERERLQHITTLCQDNSIFLVGCGMAGVTVSTSLGDRKPRLRPLAP
jgi:hypothetical protein